MSSVWLSANTCEIVDGTNASQLMEALHNLCSSSTEDHAALPTQTFTFPTRRGWSSMARLQVGRWPPGGLQR